MTDWLKGKKSYLIGLGMILVVGAEGLGYISAETARLLDNVLLGGAIMALRAGVGKL